MVDYEKIGKRIYEERKYIRKLSQAVMAEELGMYQADISNLEKAKAGSGITDLSKLDMIAEYFEMPLETLIFGGEGKNMPVYYGSTMQLKKVKKAVRKSHEKILLRLLGAPEGAKLSDIGEFPMYNCGPYVIYCPSRVLIGYDKETDRKYRIYTQTYYYVLFGDEVAAIMVTDSAGVMQHIFEPALKELSDAIPYRILDVMDPLRTINPYWALRMYAESEEQEEEYARLMYKRMDQIRDVAQDDQILYVENVYVREDYRRKGVCRMLLDLLKKENGDCITWLNMEPTAGNELDREYGYMTSYTPSELGQLNINAAIAEHLGLTVDPDTWHIQADRLDDDGNITTQVLEVRKCAYRLPEKFRKIIENDGDLVALGRARQQIANQHDEGSCEMDINSGEKDGYIIFEEKLQYIGGKMSGTTVYCYSARNLKNGKTHYGVSNRSAIDHGVNNSGVTERYESISEAEQSEYYDALQVVASMLAVAEESEQEDQELPVFEDDIADIDLSKMDFYDADAHYNMYEGEAAGDILLILGVKTMKGRWAFKQLYGTAYYTKAEESVEFHISDKSYEDVLSGKISSDDFQQSVIEHYMSDDGSLPMPSMTDFYVLYAQMQSLIIEQIMENCRNS